MLKKLLSISLIIIFIFLFTGCDDLIGGDIDIFSKENNIRIISLSSNQTEILIALGLEENIIALNSFDKFLTEDKEIIGDISGLDMDRIIELSPDLIVDFNDKFINDFQGLSLDYNSFSPNSIDSIKDNILSLGELAGESDKAKDLVKNIDDEIKKIKSSLPGERKNVMVEIWHEPLTFAKPDSYIDELVSLLECDLSQNLSEMNVYIAYDNFPERKVSNNIFFLDKDLTIPGINVVDALKELFNIIY